MGIYKQANLSKGAKLFYVKNKISKTTNVKISFDCGSRCDTIPGIAHFAEHMFFSGTKSMSRQEINKKYFDFINVNAFTSNVEISFEGNVFSKEFEEYIKTVAVMITETTFDQAEVEKECPIIQQEIARKKDKFNALSNYRNMLNITSNEHYKGYGALGTDESVETVKSNDLKTFVSKYFVANNAKVYVSSPMSLFKIKSIVEKNLISKLSSDETFKQLPYYSAYVKNSNFYDVKTMDIGKNYLYINFPHNNNLLNFEFRAKYGLLLDMINNFSTGILKYIREEKQLVYGASMYSAVANDKEYVTTFSTECGKDKVEKVIVAVSEYLNQIAKVGFSQDQLDHAKRLFKYDLDAKEPRVREHLSRLENFVQYGRIIKGEIAKLAKKVTLEECNELFKEIFVNNKGISLTVYGDITKEELLQEDEFKKLY